LTRHLTRYTVSLRKDQGQFLAASHEELPLRNEKVLRFFEQTGRQKTQARAILGIIPRFPADDARATVSPRRALQRLTAEANAVALRPKEQA
jgi:hypothetical protein